jgi:hypothetical protein
MEWVGHIPHSGEMRNAYLKREDHLGNLGTEGRIILNWILREIGHDSIHIHDIHSGFNY